jgi:hypothetical protein
MRLRRKTKDPVPALDLGTLPIDGIYPVVLMRTVAADIIRAAEALQAAADQLAREANGDGGRHTH